MDDRPTALIAPYPFSPEPFPVPAEWSDVTVAEMVRRGYQAVGNKPERKREKRKDEQSA